MVSPSFALNAIKISSSDMAVDLTHATEIYSKQGEDFQLVTAADIDGIVRRIEVRSSNLENRGDWAVFALANTSDVQLERLIVAPHFRLVGSHFFFPDLGSRRIISVTPSEGFSLEQLPNPDSDIFRITINPRSIVTFVMELTVPNLPQIYLWEPDFYKDMINSFTLYRGIVLGIAGLLAVLLSVLFMVNRTSILIATVAIAWVVLGYICIDFGFLSKMMHIPSDVLPIWRAFAEMALSSSLIIFLFIYFNLNRWHTRSAYIMFGWIICLAILFCVYFYNPSIVAGISRLSFAFIVVCGIFCITYFGKNGYNRAILLIPAWIVIVIWSISAYMAITGRLDNDIIQLALGGGLVLIVLLIGLIVMQSALSSVGITQGLFSDMECQSLAIIGSGDIVWDWDMVRDKIITIPDISTIFGFDAGSMHGPIHSWLLHMHPDDRDQFRAMLDSFSEHRRGRLRHEFRIHAKDRQFHWIVLRIRPVLNTNGEIVHCVGIASDITEHKRSIERLLHDAFTDNVTRLPNRQIFLDRLAMILSLSADDDKLRPTVIVMDIDRYKKINDTLGIEIGDNVIIALSRRVRRLLRPKDTLARLSGDRFGIILMSERDPLKIADFISTISKSMVSPINLFNQKIVMTASFGLVGWTNPRLTAIQMLKDAELAMYRAKNKGEYRIEAFRPSFRSFGIDQLQMKEDLFRAIEKSELYLVYQPIIRLKDEEIMGFEALALWNHPKLGKIFLSEFLSCSEDKDIINAVHLFVLERIAADIIQWQDQAGNPPVFISINIPSIQLLNDELCKDMQAIISKTLCSPQSIKLEFSETIIMENPEKSRILLDQIQSMGIGLILNGFGTRFSLVSYINQLKFDFVKVNGSLLLGSTKQRISILQSIVLIAQKLEMEIMATGIDGGIGVRELAEMGCNYGSGSSVRFDSVLKLLKKFPLVKNK
ncbi:MAG: EAL domain-containing protein [Candidatus Liberibacter ctenarytainae]|uniref:EAL domain-containing protein n=1 Tax=Candidatus Liberibacter ctenarytainae TaxID=2020335 RepID=A0A937APX7_9HYPH|nr:EAL domain-containing protein [Candidatus Liberibacter ctenarytainae]